MYTGYTLMLIILDTNKIACWSSIRRRNGRTARNVLYLLSLSSWKEHVHSFSFTPRSTSLFLPYLFSPSLFSTLTFPLRRGDSPLIYLPPRVQPSRFVYVAIRLFCSYKYLMPVLKVAPNCRGEMYLISVATLLRYSTPPANQVQTSAQPIPWDTVFQSIYILSLLRELRQFRSSRVMPSNLYINCVHGAIRLTFQTHINMCPSG